MVIFSIFIFINVFLLKYATNIKEEKLKNCEELLDREITNQLEKEEEIERLKTLRLESFKLNPRSASQTKLKQYQHHHHHHHIHEHLSNDVSENSVKDANHTEEPNNNYLGSKERIERSHLDSGLGSPSSVSSSSTDLHESYSDADLVSKNQHLKRDFQLYDVIDFVQKGMNVSI